MTASNGFKLQRADILFLDPFLFLRKSVSSRYRSTLGSKAAISNFETD
jgi:hypothetical protein